MHVTVPAGVKTDSLLKRTTPRYGFLGGEREKGRRNTSYFGIIKLFIKKTHDYVPQSSQAHMHKMNPCFSLPLPKNPLALVIFLIVSLGFIFFKAIRQQGNTH